MFSLRSDFLDCRISWIGVDFYRIRFPCSALDSNFLLLVGAAFELLHLFAFMFILFYGFLMFYYLNFFLVFCPKPW